MNARSEDDLHADRTYSKLDEVLGPYAWSDSLLVASGVLISQTPPLEVDPARPGPDTEAGQQILPELSPAMQRVEEERPVPDASKSGKTVSSQ